MRRVETFPARVREIETLFLSRHLEVPIPRDLV
jgi:hypothetical protein